MNAELGARILIIEDEEGVRRVLANNLSRRGFKVHAAESGRDGLEVEPVFRPDLILLDLGLPDLDGFAVIKTLRERTSTPIVILSVRGAEADKVRALDVGADDYLTKPFGLEEMLARVEGRPAPRIPRGQRISLPQRRPRGRSGATFGVDGWQTDPPDAD